MYIAIGDEKKLGGKAMKDMRVGGISGQLFQ